MDDAALINELTRSFTKQLSCYRQLESLVGKALSSVVLSRGDLSQVMSGMSEKQELLQEITEERNTVREAAEEWQHRKKMLAGTPEAAGLASLFEETELSIKRFLKIEEQLKTYLEHIINKKESEP
ncbi:MAG: hypothetical protein GF350_07475 [Chitinivibrionales bacterium]|nr:hypothetical protein [Chitinivibrionales bacterium]